MAHPALHTPVALDQPGSGYDLGNAYVIFPPVNCPGVSRTMPHRSSVKKSSRAGSTASTPQYSGTPSVHPRRAYLNSLKAKSPSSLRIFAGIKNVHGRAEGSVSVTSPLSGNEGQLIFTGVLLVVVVHSVLLPNSRPGLGR
jgi:hypothetical protein